MEMKDGPGEKTTNMIQALTCLKAAMGKLLEIWVLIRQQSLKYQPKTRELERCLHLRTWIRRRRTTLLVTQGR